MSEWTRRETLGILGAALGLEATSVDASIFFGPEAPDSPGRIENDPDSRRSELYRLLGDLPDRDAPIQARLLEETATETYRLEKLELDLNGIEPVPAVFVRPLEGEGPFPTLLFNHSHGGGYDIGKKEFLEGRSYLQPKPYAEEITARGWAGLCIDHWVFGERAHTSEMDMFKGMLWRGRVLWGMMVFDSLRAVDYLVSRPNVDETRLGTLGISMGSTMAWWLAALDERILATVDICCLTEFQTLVREKGLGRHGVYYYVPGLLNHFTTADINALIAPRPHLALAGLQDGLTPVEGLDIIDRELQKVYAEMGVPENWKLLRYDVKHQETPEGREEILKFLDIHLG